MPGTAAVAALPAGFPAPALFLLPALFPSAVFSSTVLSSALFSPAAVSPVMFSVPMGPHIFTAPTPAAATSGAATGTASAAAQQQKQNDTIHSLLHMICLRYHMLPPMKEYLARDFYAPAKVLSVSSFGRLTVSLSFSNSSGPQTLPASSSCASSCFGALMYTARLRGGIFPTASPAPSSPASHYA